jgi:hypothetical protein
MPMGSHARALGRVTAALIFAGSFLGAPRARAAGMDPTPERLVLQPTGLPNGLTCQQFAANPGMYSGSLSLAPGSYSCRPDNVAFKNLMSELGFALAPSVMHPARTVGFAGFVLSLEAAYTSINADGVTNSGASHIPYWHYGTQGSTDAAGNYSTMDNSPDSILGMYTLMVRKGLPFGFELDGALGYVQNTSLWTLGADVRWALLEGFRTGALGYFPDFAVGSGVRTVTGTSKLYLTTVGIDAEISKPITLADEAQITPYLGYQHLMIYGNSAVLDATPNVDALSQCGYLGRQPSGPNAGQPICKNNIPGPPSANGQPTTAQNDVDFNNNITFDAVRINRERMFVGVTYRYELLYVGAQFLFELPTAIDSDLNPTRQWTTSLQGGVFF